MASPILILSNWRVRKWPQPLYALTRYINQRVGGLNIRSALLINRGRVEMALTTGKPVFAVLVLESAPKSYPTALHTFVQPLIKEFKDVFLKNYPLVFLPRGVLNTRLTWFLEPLYLTNLSTDATPLKLRNYRGKFKNWLIEDMWGKALARAEFQPSWCQRKMAVGV